MPEMLSLNDAQQRLLDMVFALPVEEISTDKALGRWLARVVSAKRTQPAADLSAMDGYAIAGEGPWLHVGESRAGTPYTGTLSNGECVRISTGAHMPQGSDRVLLQENASVAGDRVQLRENEDAPRPGQHVRKVGFDFSIEDTLLTAGTMIGSAQIALALAGGVSTLPAPKVPKIAILDSGDELVRLPAEVADHQIPASNGAMLKAMIGPIGGKAELIGPVPDDLEALATALEQANDCDILITSGGASVGDHDLIQQALRDWGAKIDFWKVAIKPGKPLMVAARHVDGRSQIVLGLPGNPVSSFVTCFLFALPLVRAMMGSLNPLPAPQNMRTAMALPAGGTRDEFLRGISDGETVTLTDSQDSSALRSLASANCLIFRSAQSGALGLGEEVPVYWL